MKHQCVFSHYEATGTAHLIETITMKKHETGVWMESFNHRQKVQLAFYSILKR
jgi:hypothetical protein